MLPMLSLNQVASPQDARDVGWQWFVRWLRGWLQGWLAASCKGDCKEPPPLASTRGPSKKKETCVVVRRFVGNSVGDADFHDA